MQSNVYSSGMTVKRLLTLEDLGLKRSVNLVEASRGLAERAEAQIVHWIQFPAGALFFTLVPGDPESGAIFVFHRRKGVFYALYFNDQKWGGYSLADYENLLKVHRLVRFAQRPWRLERWCGRRPG